MRSFNGIKVRVNGVKRVMDFASLKEMADFAYETKGISYITLYMRLRPLSEGGLGWTPEQALRVKVNRFSRREVTQEEKHINAMRRAAA